MRDTGGAAGAQLVADLLTLPPDERRPIYRAFTEREMRVLVNRCRKELGSPYGLWQDDLTGFVEDVIGDTVWSKQRQVFDAIVAHERVGVPSTHSSSKTFGAARTVAWWCSVWPTGTVQALTLAPTFRQVKNLMWPEIRAAQYAGRLPGVVQQAQWKIGDEVVAYGLSPAPWDEAALQGVHCFDDQTELLTDEGWKPFPDVTGSERVLSLRADGVAEWGPISHVVREPFDGNLNLHDGTRVNFCVTDSHRLLVRGLNDGQIRRTHLSVDDGELIKKRKREGETAATLAAEFGVSENYVYEIARGDRDGRLRTEPIDAVRWTLRAYSDLPNHFIIRRTNTWEGSNPTTVVFDQPTIEIVLCAGCGERLDGPPIEERTRARAGGAVYHAECRRVASRAQVTCSRCGTWFSMPRAQALRGERFFCPGSTLCRTGASMSGPVSHVVIPEPGPSIGVGPDRGYRRYEFDFRDWAEFLGWYVAEGSTTRNAVSSWTVNVAQKPGAKYEQIAVLMTRMGIRFSRTPSGLRFGSAVVGAWLREHCGVGSHNKKIPHSIKEASTEMIDVFLAAFGKGDGCPHNHADSYRYATSSKQLADDLHEVLCKVGRGRVAKPMKSQAVGSWATMSTTGREFQRRAQGYYVMDPGVPVDSDVHKKNVVRHPYRGTVYCVSTPHQTIMVRRKGCSMWSGNSQHVLLVVDEAGGIGHVVGRALVALLSNPHARLLMIGNPPTDEEGGWFEEQCEKSALVETVRISAYDTPNFTGEQTGRCTTCDPAVPAHRVALHLTPVEWVDEVTGEFGEDSAFVVARVHAQFPRGMGRKTIPYAWVEAAATNENPAAGSWVRVGADIASDGGDEFVIAQSVGFSVQVLHRSSGAANVDPVQVAGIITQHVREACEVRDRVGDTQLVHCKIDASGLGWGVAGLVKRQVEEQGLPTRVLPVRGEDKPNDEAAFRNARSELWWNTRRLMRPTEEGHGQVRLVNAPTRLIAQLQAPNYTTDSAGRIVVEKKREMKARGVGSPDLADAVLLCLYEPPGTSDASIERAPQTRIPTRPTEMGGGGGANVIPLGPTRR